MCVCVWHNAGTKKRKWLAQHKWNWNRQLSNATNNKTKQNKSENVAHDKRWQRTLAIHLKCKNKNKNDSIHEEYNNNNRLKCQNWIMYVAIAVLGSVLFSSRHLYLLDNCGFFFCVRHIHRMCIDLCVDFLNEKPHDNKTRSL